jgi:hypothetical protein
VDDLGRCHCSDAGNHELLGEGGLLATISGHLLDSRPFPRPIAAAWTALFAGCSAIAQTLAKRELGMFDRVALIGFLAAFMGGFLQDTPVCGLIYFGLGFVCLLAAWVRQRFSSAY